MYVGAAEGVDALCIVAHHADVLETGGKLLYYQILCVVGVLVLVDEDVLESVLVFQQHIGEVAQEYVGVEEQVVEVHSHSVAKTAVVELVDLANHWLVGCLVGLLYLGVGAVVLGSYQAALGHRYAAHDIAGIVDLGVEAEALDDLFYGRFAVVGVVDGEAVDVAYLGGFGTQDARKD